MGDLYSATEQLKLVFLTSEEQKKGPEGFPVLPSILGFGGLNFS